MEMVKGLGAGHGKPPVLVLEGLIQKPWSGSSQEGRDRWAETWKPGRKGSREEGAQQKSGFGGHKMEAEGERREQNEDHVSSWREGMSRGRNREPGDELVCSLGRGEPGN